MKKTVQTQISKIIRDNLSDQVAGELKSVIEEHAELKKDKVSLEKSIERKDKIIDERDTEVAVLTTTLNEYMRRGESVKNQQEELLQAQARLADEQMNLKLDKLQTELHASQRFGNEIATFMQGLSRNTIYRKNVLGSKDQFIPATPEINDSNGYTTQYASPATTMPINTSSDETVSEE